MTDHVLATGTSGIMTIRDDGVNSIEFWIQADVDAFAPEMPWTFTLNGITEGWRSFNFTGGAPQLVTTLWVGYTQTVVFKMGETGIVDLGGPTDLSVEIFRGSSTGVARVKSGTIHKTALAYVRDGGVWKPAETWVKVASVWRRTG